MFVLRRRDGQWVRVVHSASGDEMYIRVYDLDPQLNEVRLAFDDGPRNFRITRPEAQGATREND